MTRELRSGICQYIAEAVGIATNPFPPPPAVIPAQAGIHAYRDVGGRAASGTSGRGRRAEGCRHSKFCQMARPVVIPACAGMDFVNHWIPAFAGMTEEGCSQVFVRNGKGLSGWQPTFSLLVVIPAQAGIHAYRDVGGRAASGTGGRGRRRRGDEWIAGFAGWRVRLSLL